MTEAARAGRKSPRREAPDIALVPDAPKPAPAEPPAAHAKGKAVAAGNDGVTPPPVTLEDPWRYLHPSRVWPD